MCTSFVYMHNHDRIVDLHIGSSEHMTSLAQGVFACIVGLYSAMSLVKSVNV